MQPMDLDNYEPKIQLTDLISRYEVMSQKGKVAFEQEAAFLTLIDHFEKEFQYEKALEVVDYAMMQHRHNVDFLLRKANLLIQNQDTRAVLCLMDKALEVDPANPDLHFIRSKALSLLERQEEALIALESIKGGVNASYKSEILLSEALIYEQLQQYELMFDCLTEAIVENPDNNDALRAMYSCVEHSRKYKHSLQFHERLINEKPYCSLAWFNLGHAYYYFNEYKKAEMAFEYAFLIDEKFEYAYRDCAEVNLHMQKYEKALNCLLIVSELIEPDTDLLCKIGECYDKIGDLQKAKVFLFRALSLDPLDDEINYNVALTYHKEMSYENAIFYFEKAIKIEANREEYYMGMAKTYEKLGAYDKAIDCYQTGVDIGPEFIEHWITYASSLIKKDRIRQALLVLEDAEINSCGSEIQFCKAACLFLLGKEQEGFNSLEAGLIEDFSKFELFFDFAPHLFSHKKINAMIRYYKGEQ